MTQKPIRIVSIMWSTYLSAFLAAAKASPHVSLSIFSNKEIEEDADNMERFWEAAREADAILLFWTRNEFWDEISARLPEVAPGKVVITTSSDPENWGRASSVDMAVCAQAYAYVSQGGQENYGRLLEFVAHHVDDQIPVRDPIPLPWQGIYHPPDMEVYETEAEYRKVHPAKFKDTVGLLFSRSAYTSSDSVLEKELILALERQGLDALPVFTYHMPDPAVGALGSLASARKYFLDEQGRPRIAGFINLQFSFLGRKSGDDPSETAVAGQTIEFFKQLNVPVFKPVICYSQSVEEWEENPQGLTTEVTFGIAMPEFEGCIEPIPVACSQKHTDDASGSVFETRDVITDRVGRVAERIARWVRMGRKPPHKRKVVFVLHKNECAGLEANIGGAGGLDTGESVVGIMRRMRDAGYNVVDIPESGEELMQTILARKAIAEFRWTTVDEIIAKGGHLALLPNDVYQQWYRTIPEEPRALLTSSWGDPPGQELNGVPPSMVYEDQLVITGLNFGDVNVMMQPKRGCAGSRCDGQVCKILHDPLLPPPHQYVATYMYMDKIFGADVIIHVGTHGNLEWLPGKGAGLSASCWPDIVIGSMPHLYIYNADNPAEGAVAKRRSYAVLNSHMQAVMTTADTYGSLAELDELLGEYHRSKLTEPARAHQLEHLIKEAIDRCNMSGEIEKAPPKDFEAVAEKCHAIISRTRNSQTVTGMHVFGRTPDSDERAEIINTILRFDSANELNTRRLVFDSWGEDIDVALETPAARGKSGQLYGDMLYEADRKAMDGIARLIDGLDDQAVINSLFSPSCPDSWKVRFSRFADLVREIDHRITMSDEIDSLFNAQNGGYVPAGPSGFISRGRYDILPTGRNFYNVDPTRVPTQAAWRVGVRLAEALLERYLKEEGRYPEQIGMVWLAADIMRADGEQLGQIMHLLGARPRWKANGQLDGFDIVPTTELGRPRIDVHIRVSGISRDCFPDILKFLDSVVQAIALTDESPEDNYVRKHILKTAADQGSDLSDREQLRRLSYRIFSAQPGAFRSGVNLAIYASAWKTAKDLSDIYVFWNGYAYGGGNGEAEYGVAAHKELVSSLKRVEVTFDKHISDQTDFLNCCGFFGNYGGMTAAAHELSGKKPKTYYGDTRDPAKVEVTDFADEMRRIVRAKLLNPKFIEGMKAHGYKGAGTLSKRIGRVYGFAATTNEVDDWIFDEIAETFVLNEEMRKWFQEVNPWALEEVGRRLLEAASREIWNPDDDLLDRLKEAYLDVEATIEDTMSDVTGDFQGGAVDIFQAEDVAGWKEEMDKVLSGLGLDK